MFLCWFHIGHWQQVLLYRIDTIYICSTLCVTHYSFCSGKGIQNIYWGFFLALLMINYQVDERLISPVLINIQFCAQETWFLGLEHGSSSLLESEGKCSKSHQLCPALAVPCSEQHEGHPAYITRKYSPQIRSVRKFSHLESPIVTLCSYAVTITK